jgi:hypothetical protein
MAGSADKFGGVLNIELLFQIFTMTNNGIDADIQFISNLLRDHTLTNQT